MTKVLKKSRVVEKPEYDDTFSLSLLREYLVHLMSRGCQMDLCENESSHVDLKVVFEKFVDSCTRLKEPLFVFALVEGRVEELFEVLDASRSKIPSRDKYFEAVKDEWEAIYREVDGRALDDAIMEETMPYRYARMSQAAKSWKFRNEMYDWHCRYGAFKDENQKL